MEQLQIKCSICDREYTHRKNLYVHLRNAHKIEPLKPKLVQPAFQCGNCGKKFVYQSSLTRHLKVLHSSDNETNDSCLRSLTKRIRLICPEDGCGERFSNNVHLRQHLKERHDVNIEFEDLTFNSIADFEKWKKTVENETRSLYTLDTGVRPLLNGTSKKTYNCHRSFTYKSKSKNIRTLTTVTNKIGRACPARIEVTFQNDEQSTISVKFWKTHCGHTKVQTLEPKLLKPTLECGNCHKKFLYNSSLSRHTKNFHSPDNEGNKRITLICPQDGCGERFLNYVNLRQHLMERHDVYVEFEDLTFNSAADFEKWKNQIQDETQSFFTLVGGMKPLLHGRSKKTYNCHRSFTYKSKGKNIRSSTRAYNKIGRACPARIEVIFQNDKQTTISVKFWKTHCGHTEGIGRVISKELSGGRIECGVCKMIFFMQHHFETHICNGKAKKPKEIPCPDCQKTFSSRFNMIRHSHFHSNKRLNNAKANGSLTEKTVELVVNVKKEETFTAVNEPLMKYEEKSVELSDTIVPKDEPMEEYFEIVENSLQASDYRTREMDQNSNNAPSVKVESIKL